MGRQHQGMDKPGVRKVPEGSGEQGKMEETGCNIICGAPQTLMIVERTKKVETRPGEQSEKTDNCREELWNEVQLKGL